MLRVSTLTTDLDMHAFLKFHRGIMQMPRPWQVWLMLLVTANLVIPLFFLHRLEAQVVLAALLGSLVLFTVLTARVGFTRLLGLGHVLWVPLIWFLWTRLGDIPAGGFYGIWIRAVMALNAASLAIDVVDVIRYVAGDRAETVEGL